VAAVTACYRCAMTSYTVRNWLVLDLPVGAVHDLPIGPASIPARNVINLESPAAASLEAAGVENVFYVDLEQETAGLDEVYGSSGLEEALEDFTLPNGVEITKGSLVLTITRVDMVAGTMTTLFETK
jgi:hypothetical protein